MVFVGAGGYGYRQINGKQEKIQDRRITFKRQTIATMELEVQGMYQKASRSSLESFEWPLQQ